MCDCVAKVNAGIADRNAVLDEISMMNMDTGKVRQSLVIRTVRLNDKPKKYLKAVCPSYCPFCGEKIKTTVEE